MSAPACQNGRVDLGSVAMILRVSFVALLSAVVTASASAQPYPDHRRPHHGASAWYMRDWYGGMLRPPCCVLGPAYGRPGEPLGPAYNLGLRMSNPRVCGPGACQDNPYY